MSRVTMENNTTKAKIKLKKYYYYHYFYYYVIQFKCFNCSPANSRKYPEKSHLLQDIWNN